MSLVPPALNRVAFLGNHPPRLCGLATFTADLRSAVAHVAPDVECLTVAMTDNAGPYTYPPEVRLEVPDADFRAYGRAADFLNEINVDVLSVQHEYGIFGGADGELVLELLQRVRMPVAVTLHTVLERPTKGQRRVMDEILRRAARVVVMGRHSRAILERVHGVAAERVALIPHGIPETPFLDSHMHKVALGVEGRTVLLTFGLLSPGKGIEHAIRAMPAIVARRPDALYLVVGATHPNLKRREGEAYRMGLQRLAQRLGVTDHVRFVDDFVDLPMLTRAVAAADIYLTPYLNEAQSVSGTLAYSFGMGKAVVSTPYWHAAELLGDGRGILVPFGESAPIADAVLGLLDDPPRLLAMRQAAYRLGRQFVWPRIGERYLDVFRAARLEKPGRTSSAPSSTAHPALAAPAERRAELPAVTLRPLAHLVDSTGVAQHAVHGVAERAHGYCLDDNARGLILATLLPRDSETEGSLSAERLFSCTAAFVQHAWNGQAGRFRNFMAYDRRWLDESGSEDSHARAVWALGTVIRCAGEARHRAWAQGLIEPAVESLVDFTSPRAWAFGLLGIVDYLIARPEDRHFVRRQRLLAERLSDHLQRARGPGWTWFEDVLAYDNARLPQALVAAGRQASRDDWQESGLEALDWLRDVQTAAAGHFRPIGSQGFWRRGEPRPMFDQQPLDAQASVEAYLEAWRSTRSLRWLTEARRAFDWFLGANDLGEPLYDVATGACFDGLLCDRVNGNQGGESTLAFILATVEMRAALADASHPDPQEAAKTAW